MITGEERQQLGKVQDALALLRAYTEGDEEATSAVLGMCGHEELACTLAGMLLGVLAYGKGVDPRGWVLGEQAHIRELLAG